LRSVLEEAMLEVMYELPSEENVTECVINEQVISNGDYPVLLFENKENKKSA
jgi:ATP-dependent Clp protease ATP-binding subunit ClpX